MLGEAMMHVSPYGLPSYAGIDCRLKITAKHSFHRSRLTCVFLSLFVAQSRVALSQPLNNSGSLLTNSTSALIALLVATVIALIILIVRDRRYARHLAESNRRLALATSSNGIGIWERDLRNNTLHWDPSMFRLYGFNRDSFQGYLSWIGAIHPDDRERIKSFAKAATDAAIAHSLEFRILLPDQSVRYIKSVGNVDTDIHGTPIRVLGVSWDVTEQKLAEQELLNRRATDIELQEKLVTLHDVGNQLSRANSTDEFTRNAVALAQSRLGFERLGIWYYDEKTETMQGSYGIDEHGQIRDERAKRFKVSHNENARDYHMISSEMSIEFEDDVELYDDSSVVIGRGQSVRVSIWNGRNGIGFLSFDNAISGQPISLVQQEIAKLFGAAVGHIYSRRLTDDALAESEERLKMAAEAANSGIWAWDAKTNAFYWSDRVYEIFGVAKQTTPVPYARYLKLIHEEDRAATMVTIEDAIRRGTRYSVTHRIVRPDGSIRWVEGNGHISRNDKGDLTRITGTVVDISERKRMEEALVQSSKLESIGRLAGGIAHDFNNMLGVIIGYAEMVQESVKSDADLSRFVSNISTTAERAAELTSQLLAFARKQVFVSRVVDLNAILLETELILDRLLPPYMKLNSCPSPVPVWINADSSQIQQIILNLALNARDAMPEKGMLTIRIRTSSSVEIAAIDSEFSLPPGNYASIVVTDTGTGIAEQHLSKIFEPFFTTKELGRGTGIGLATVYGIVKQNMGNIKVTSKLNVGSEFTVYLPCADGPRLKEPVIRAPSRSADRGTVLVVEDQAELRDLIRGSLARSGFNVLAAPNGIEALSAARSYDGEIKLLLTDLIMPGMGGQELAAVISQELPRIKVLMMTGYSDSSVEGSEQILYKPFTLATLVDKVKEQFV